ncbi:SH3 domain-containing protein [Streptomyces lasiicapitis]|uniref:SH3b domain-containing protein n=1 Tax=Streptomyces lasiicapitis TaxID=1923961 RepID=A0ABQ2LII6_9ACTN|nr:SH3 domain-containing protein [Streptomyces lasiicapitis]GGO35689.1 hypothetical protein GCM10012286_06710 [Streptomyces lasiicapitis]
MASKTVVGRVLFTLALALSVGMVGVSAASAAPPPAAPPPAAAPVKAAPSMPIPGPGGLVQTYSAGSDGRLSYGEIAAATVNGLRVRSGPGTGYTALGLLGKGDKVRLIGARQDKRGQIWHRVVLRHSSDYGLPRGYRGWVTASYLY